jgi:hypothetical protein
MSVSISTRSFVFSIHSFDYELVDTDFPFFPAPRFILLYVHKRGCGVLETMSVGSKIVRVSPPSKRIDNVELFRDAAP